MSDLQAVTRSDMRFETSKDVTLSKLLEQIHNGKWSRDTDLEPYSRIKEDLSIFEGVILTGNRIVVPQSLRKQILSLAHETHQGIVKTKQFLRIRFFWPGMDDATEKNDQKLSSMRGEPAFESRRFNQRLYLVVLW